MRTELSHLITSSAVQDPHFLVLSGDHGYALFDEIRRKCPDQFINVGVMEQTMIGVAAGLAKTGYRPLVYGLSAFVPIRVLEQIKLDLCFPNLPVVLLGDGAGLVYSTLGASHQCAEDISCLRPLPNLKIFSPGDKEELRICYLEAISYSGPSYIRIGKSDRPPVHTKELTSTEPLMLRSSLKSRTCLAALGSMISVAHTLSNKYDLAAVTIPRVKPFPDKAILSMLGDFDRIIVLEEHSRSGGLFSGLAELFADHPKRPMLFSLSLKEQFAKYCGSYEYALSEHGMANSQIEDRIREYFL